MSTIKLNSKTRIYFVPLLMSIIFVAQITMVYKANLSRWRLAGFGMYSEVHYKSKRDLELTVLDIHGDVFKDVKFQFNNLEIEDRWEILKGSLQVLPTEYFAKQINDFLKGKKVSYIIEDGNLPNELIPLEVAGLKIQIYDKVFENDYSFTRKDIGTFIFE